MVELISVDPKKVDYEVEHTNGAHAQFSYLGTQFESHLDAVAAIEEEGDEEEM